MCQLNTQQREFVMHILRCFKTNRLPLRIFLSGAAGVGKSLVISCLYQLITKYFDDQPGDEKNSLVVLLCASSGKAAFAIGGITLHTAFVLPLTQFGGVMPELSNDVANTIRTYIAHVKLLIIDEISMVGSTMFSRVDTRLRQIMGLNESFGGVSVIIVGDLSQLPPVMDSPIYMMPRSHDMARLILCNPLWDEFYLYELTKIMRQQSDSQFTDSLNNVAKGKATEADVKLFRTRQVSDDQVPQTAIRLFADNKRVDAFNERKVRIFPGECYTSVASDVVVGELSEKKKCSIIQNIKRKSTSQTNGLPYMLNLKVGIKYTVISNLCIEDGLVNGACGILKTITFCLENKNMPSILWLSFTET